MPGETAPTRSRSLIRRVGDARWRAALVVAATYLVLSVAMWWNVWSAHPASTASCGCGDTSLFTWFMAWPAYAIAHGQNPLFTTAAHHPYGINLVANTGSLLIGTVLAPVTWLFGPVVSLNVAATLAPVASGLGAYVLLRRWTSWVPAAFVGGLLFGFSPFVVDTIAFGYVHLGTLVIPPLLFLCLDELLVRQRGRAWTWGLGLGLLATAQFFISSEVLAMCVLAGALGTVVVVVAAAVGRPAALRRHWAHAAAGTGIGAAVAAVLLAYPVWFATDGPRHAYPQAWPLTAVEGSRWHDTLFAVPSAAAGPDASNQLLGYSGSLPVATAYLGIGLVAVVAVGLIVWRRDARLWFCAVMVVLVDALATGVTSPGFSPTAIAVHPWRLVMNAPFAGNILPERLTVVSSLFVALMLAVVVDRTAAWGRVASMSPQAGGPSGGGRTIRARLVAALVAAVALVPIAVHYALPYRVEPTDVPQWFTTAGLRLPPRTVVLTYPYASSGLSAAMTWVAVGDLHLWLVGGGGIVPQPPLHPTPARVRDDRVAAELSAMSRVSLYNAYLPLPDGSRQQLVDTRAALADWGVDVIVVPHRTGVPAAIRTRSESFALAFFTAVTGSRPAWQDGSWVWELEDVATSGPLTLGPGRLRTCADQGRVTGRPSSAIDCVLSGAAAGTGAVP